MPPERPDYRVTPDILAITQAAQGKQGRVRLKFLHKRKVFRAYRGLFFKPDGALRPEAAIVIRDLAEKSGIGMATAGLEHEELACREGERRLFLHLLGQFSLNEIQIRNLERQLEEEEGQ